MKQNLLNSVQVEAPPLNTFDLTHTFTATVPFGYLIPCCVMETVPGDTFELGCEALVRMQPLVNPVMQRYDITIHYFFCPNRILWPNWEKYIAPETQDAIRPTHPYYDVETTTYGGTISNPNVLLNYLGIPLTGDATLVNRISAIPMAVYQKIYNEYYRDQNLVIDGDGSLLFTELVDGDNVNLPEPGNWLRLVELRYRAWEHDYFTAALPFAQKGQPVLLPVGTFQDVPVVGDLNVAQTNATIDIGLNPGPVPSFINILIEDLDLNAGYMFAKTSDLIVSATTINDFRTAEALQKWLEIMARGGTRYTEVIKAHFNVTSSNKALQRPEYITGVKAPIQISEVLNTSGNADITVPDPLPQGNMAGHGVGYVSGYQGRYFCEEHGYIMGILSIRPKTTYFQGIPKHFLKYTDPTELYWPKFAHLGEQPILNREIYAWGPTATKNDTFGYLPRNTEYRTIPNRIAGDLQTTLSSWAHPRVFEELPGLNKAFIECQPSNQIFAVTDNNAPMIVSVMNHVKARRPMPIYGTPSLF